MKPAKKRDPFAYQAAKRAAAELVKSWPLDRLHNDDAQAGATTSLCHSWGLDYADARTIVASERAMRRQPANDRR